MPCSNSTINRGDAPKQTIYCPGRGLGKDDDIKEKLSFSSSSFELLFDNATTETGRGLEAATLVVKPVAVRAANKANIPTALRSWERPEMEDEDTVASSSRDKASPRPKDRRPWQRS